MKLKKLFTAVKHGTKQTEGVVASFESDGSFAGLEEKDLNTKVSPDVQDAEAIIREKVTEDELAEVSADGLVDEKTEEAINAKVSSMESGIRAAAIAAVMLQGDKVRSLKTAAMKKTHGSDINVIGMSTGIESFQVQKFEEFHEETCDFNLYATKQSPFGECFAPMLVGTPDKSDWRLSLSRIIYGRYATHSATESIVERSQYKTIQEAYTDPEALRNNSTDLVPFWRDQVKSSFVDITLNTPVQANVDGQDFATAPLKAGVEHQLFGLSQHPGRSEAYTRNATIHRRVQLTTLVVQIESEDGATKEQFNIPVKGMARTYFGHQEAQNGQQMVLAFDNDKAVLSSTVKTAAKGDSALLKTTFDAGQRVGIRLEATGTVKLDRGGISVYGQATLTHIQTAGAAKMELSDELKALKVSVVGFVVNARATNSDWSTLSLIADTVVEHDVCKIGLHAPIASHMMINNSQSVGGEQSREEKLATLIEISKAYMNGYTIRSFIEYNDIVKRYCDDRDSALGLNADFGSIFEPDAIVGLGRKVLRPEYIDLGNIQIDKVINTIKSSEKVTDLRKYMAGLLGELGSRLVQNSRILTALPIYAPNSKPVVKVVTSPRLKSLLIIEGESRTFGNLDFEIVADPALTFVDQFYLQLSIDNVPANKYHILNSGYTLWIPEVVGESPLQRDSSRVIELAVQPQFEVYWNVPALAHVKIDGIEEYIANRTPVETVTTP